MTLIVILTIGAYLGVGALFAIIFVFAGVQRIDPVANRAPIQFRLLIIPGAAALWPWLLRRLIRRTPPPPPMAPQDRRIERIRRQSMRLVPAIAYGVVLVWFIARVSGVLG